MHPKVGARSSGAPVNIWLVGGALTGLIEAVATYDAKVSFSPIADWVSRLVMLPGVFALAAAAVWLVVGVGLRIAARSSPRLPVIDRARLSLALFGAALLFAHLGQAVNERLSAAVLSPLGIASSLACLVVAIGFAALLYTVAPAGGRRWSLQGIASSVCGWPTGRLLLTAGLGGLVGGSVFVVAWRPQVRALVQSRSSTAAPEGIERVLLIGLDAADWQVIWPMMRRGELPNLDRLAHEGRADYLRTFGRPNTAIVWTSAATGMKEAKHGIHGFTLKRPGSYDVMLSQSYHRQVKAIWNIASEMGKTVTVIDYPITNPAEEVNGVMIAGLHNDGGPTTHPPELRLALSGPRPMVLDPPRRVEDFAAHARDLDTRLERMRNVTLAMQRDHPADLFITYAHTTDAVQHLFWKYAFPEQFSAARWSLAGGRALGYDRVLFEHWRHTDRVVGDILRQPGDATLVIIASDHGARARPQPYTTIDVDQLLVAMRWQQPAVAGSRSDLAASLAYDAGLARYLDVVGISINLAGREPHGVVAPDQFEATLSRLVEALAAIDASDGQPLFSAVHDYRAVRDRHRDHDLGNSALDVLCELRRELGSPRSGKLELSVPALPEGAIARHSFLQDRSDRIDLQLADLVHVDPTSGQHRSRGIIIMHGPGIVPGLPPIAFPHTPTGDLALAAAKIVGLLRETDQPRPSTLDVTPTLLYALGLPVATDMDGEPLLSFFSRDYRAAHPLRWIDSYETEATEDSGPSLTRQSDYEVNEGELRYLRSLGYIN